MSKKSEKILEIYQALEQKFDKRDNFYVLLQEYFDKHGKIPLKWLPDWNTYQMDKRKWRDIPGMKTLLMKIAKKLAKNENIPKDRKGKISMDYLDKQLRRIKNDVRTRL